MKSSDAIVVFSAFTNLPEGSIEAYKYHKKGKFLNKLYLLLCVLFLIFNINLWRIRAFDGEILTSSFYTIAVLIWSWFITDTVKSLKKHVKAMNEILDHTHKACFGGCYLLEGRKHNF